jgi:hypothetical protein
MVDCEDRSQRRLSRFRAASNTNWRNWPVVRAHACLANGGLSYGVCCATICDLPAVLCSWARGLAGGRAGGCFVRVAVTGSAATKVMISGLGPVPTRASANVPSDTRVVTVELRGGALEKNRFGFSVPVLHPRFAAVGAGGQPVTSPATGRGLGFTTAAMTWRGPERERRGLCSHAWRVVSGESTAERRLALLRNLRVAVDLRQAGVSA